MVVFFVGFFCWVMFVFFLVGMDGVYGDVGWGWGVEVCWECVEGGLGCGDGWIMAGL